MKQPGARLIRALQHTRIVSTAAAGGLAEGQVRFFSSSRDSRNNNEIPRDPCQKCILFSSPFFGHGNIWNMIVIINGNAPPFLEKKGVLKTKWSFFFDSQYKLEVLHP